jgi:hypothetical protein
MPVIFRIGRFRFFFYANESNPREPPHVHVDHADCEAKFWLRPQVRVAYNDGFDAKILRAMLGLVVANRERARRGPGMTSSAKAKSVSFDDDKMWVELSDGRTLGIPLAWFPRLLHATPAQRQACRISSRGLHWEALDEDISVAGLLAGLGDRTRKMSTAAE